MNDNKETRDAKSFACYVFSRKLMALERGKQAILNEQDQVPERDVYNTNNESPSAKLAEAYEKLKEAFDDVMICEARCLLQEIDDWETCDEKVSFYHQKSNHEKA